MNPEKKGSEAHDIVPVVDIVCDEKRFSSIPDLEEHLKSCGYSPAEISQKVRKILSQEPTTVGRRNFLKMAVGAILAPHKILTATTIVPNIAPSITLGWLRAQFPTEFRTILTSGTHSTVGLARDYIMKMGARGLFLDLLKDIKSDHEILLPDTLRFLNRTQLPTVLANMPQNRAKENPEKFFQWIESAYTSARCHETSDEIYNEFLCCGDARTLNIIYGWYIEGSEKRTGIEAIWHHILGQQDNYAAAFHDLGDTLKKNACSYDDFVSLTQKRQGLSHENGMEKWLDEGPHGCAIYQDYLDHLEEIQTTFQEKQASCRALIEEKTQLPLEYLDINCILAGVRAVENIYVFLKKL